MEVIDYISHWHIDWAKTNITLKYGWTKDGKAFWMFINI